MDRLDSRARMKNFAICGAAGVVAPRHLEAIRATGNRVVAAFDPNDSVGVLDRFGFDIAFFTELERFDRHLEKLRRGNAERGVHYLSVCSPNHVHDAHTRLGLRLKADVICEKPLVINPWNLDALEELENETGHRVWTVLQLRENERLVDLNKRVGRGHDVELTYVTARGRWYDVSWKGNAAKSGGVPTNIGVHLYDLLVWLFGAPLEYRVHLRDERRIGGFLELERARVRWFLSVDPRDLPNGHASATYRHITVDGDALEFSEGFSDLHTRVYERTLRGEGFGIREARPSIELAYALRTAPLSPPLSDLHPMIAR
jgi:UDP-N-acetyl-2-amino-2-deoxyglucuronate dehydrogenase